MSSRVHLVNNDWDHVEVQVRVGDAGNAEGNPLLGTRDLTRGEDWVVASDGQNVWWRRDSGDGIFMQWNDQPCYPGQDEDYYPQL